MRVPKKSTYTEKSKLYFIDFMAKQKAKALDFKTVGASKRDSRKYNMKVT